jgi:lipopolysaccharide/colanic/teichoic acid biosynthesis glycosyltransferase
MRRARPAQRAADIILSAAGLLVLAPVILVAAIGVKLSSPGPVFYLAPRAGRGGRTFFMLKLRTMRQAGGAGPKITAPGDSRVTRLGRILRATKIDEMPQLLNVLKGDMSIVGPRPEDPEIVRDLYGPAETETLDARPGLTSPGTIWYYESGEDHLDADDVMQHYQTVMRHKLSIDADYLRGATLASDARIVLATIAVILRRILGARQPVNNPPRRGS